MDVAAIFDDFGIHEEGEVGRESSTDPIPVPEVGPGDAEKISKHRRKRNKERMQKVLKAEMPPPEHYYTHFPKHPRCVYCNRCKIQHSQHRARKNQPTQAESDLDASLPKDFGDKSTADHIIMGSGEQSVKGDKVSLACVFGSSQEVARIVSGQN